jgi:hypothetical protein
MARRKNIPTSLRRIKYPSALLTCSVATFSCSPDNDWAIPEHSQPIFKLDSLLIDHITNMKPSSNSFLFQNINKPPFNQCNYWTETSNGARAWFNLIDFERKIGNYILK